MADVTQVAAWLRGDDARRLAAVRRWLKYAPDEPRDDHGEWTDGGSGAEPDQIIGSDGHAITDAKAPVPVGGTIAGLRVARVDDLPNGIAERTGIDPHSEEAVSRPIANGIAAAMGALRKADPSMASEIAQNVKLLAADESGGELHGSGPLLTTVSGAHGSTMFIINTGVERDVPDGKTVTTQIVGGGNLADPTYATRLYTEGLIHEAGHVLDARTMAAGGASLNKVMYDTVAALATKRGWPAVGRILTSLSAYGAQSQQEAVAEVYHDVIRGRAVPKELDPVVAAIHAAQQLPIPAAPHKGMTRTPPPPSGIPELDDWANTPAPDWIVVDDQETAKAIRKYSDDELRDDHGRWTDGGGGPDAGASGDSRSGIVAGDREKFQALKDRWAKLNNDMLHHVDHPDDPAVHAEMVEMKGLVKEMYALKADPGGIEGIGLPGGPRDVAIIGAGPGGLSASIMAGTDGLDTVVVDANTVPGGQSKYSSRIENYPGFPVGATGDELAARLYDQAQRVGADTTLGVRATGISYDEATGLKTVTFDDGSSLQARSVILAGGVEFQQMGFEGADNPNVVYADGKRLGEMVGGGSAVVIGGSNGAAQAALGVARTASHVTVLSRSSIAKGMSNYQVVALRNNPKISIIEGDEIGKLTADARNHPVSITTKGGRTIAADGVGVFIGGHPSTTWLPPTIRTTHGKVDANGNLETSMPGVFAIGDIRNGSIGRIGAAVGDGQMAIRNAWDYFNRMPATPKGGH